jgi:serine/threonine protein kinase
MNSSCPRTSRSSPSRTSPACKTPCYFREGYDDVLDDLLYKFLALNPDKRITVEDAMSHPFFDSVRVEHDRP